MDSRKRLQKKKNYLFRVKSKQGFFTSITSRYWELIITVKHPSVKGKELAVQETLESPELIKESSSDSKVYLYYRKINGKYFCVVVKNESKRSFIITVYITNRIKKGNIIWPKK